MPPENDLTLHDDFVLSEDIVKNLASYPKIHESIAVKNGYKFFNNIDSFRVFFDMGVEYPNAEIKKNGIQHNFFLAKRKNKSVLVSKVNLKEKIKSTYNIDCDYLEGDDELINYSKPTILKIANDKYCLLGLKDIEAHNYNNNLIEKELIENHSCTYLEVQNEKIFLCLLLPTPYINIESLQFDEIVFVGTSITSFKFGGEAHFDTSNIESILEFMVRKNIANLHFNGSGERYAILIDEDKKLKCIDYATVEHIELGLIHQLKKSTNEDEYNDFKEVKKAISHTVGGVRRDFRFSIKKAKAGYRCAFRLLASEEMITDVENLNYTATALQVFKRLTDENYGIQKGQRGVIIAGSTGEGKSTLAYSIIKQLLKQRRLIAEIGNPVEIILSDDTITQFDLSDTENAEAEQRDTLLHILSVNKRQNPEVIYITEVRDAEEKREVFNHIAQGFGLIFTMHTHDTWKTLEDLITVMGEEAYKVGDSIGTIINHKLIKSVCLVCKGKGIRGNEQCTHCKGSGEKGLVPIIEKWERKLQTKILPKITKENYDSAEVCNNFHSFKDDILEQFELGRITRETATIEINKLYGEEHECILPQVS